MWKIHQTGKKPNFAPFYNPILVLRTQVIIFIWTYNGNEVPTINVKS